MSQEPELNSVIPVLRDLSTERLAELGDSVLALSVALCRQRLEEDGPPVSAFIGSI